MTVTRVEDSELLYRAVRANSGEYRFDEGVLRFTATAFNDVECRPSVDRSSMRVDPRDTRFSPTDGITSLVTRDVRAISAVSVNSPEGKITYRVDVQHRPITKSDLDSRENPAHCQVECDPEIRRTHSKRLKESLAFLATKRGWTISPEQNSS
jgi:hypothetical protein